jgi:hypothetical protein
MARIADYNSLKTQVLQTIERQQDPEASEILYDGWVSLCEDDFWPILRAPYLQRFSNFTFDAGYQPAPAVATQEFEYVPPSYVECINLADLTNRQNLDSIGVTEVVQYRAEVGLPQVYIIRGYSLTVLPVPTSPLLMELTYYSRSEPLTVDQADNDIIKRSPTIYYYGVLKQAALSYGEMQNYQMWSDMMQKAIDKVNDSAVSWNRGPTHRVRYRI